MPNKAAIIGGSGAGLGVAGLGLALESFSRYLSAQKEAAVMLLAAQDKAAQAQALLTNLEMAATSVASCQASLVELALQCASH